MFFAKFAKNEIHDFEIYKSLIIVLAIVINKNPKIESTHKGWFEELNNEKLCNFE